MATVEWRGDAPAIAQVQTITFGVWDATTTYKFTINGKTIQGLGNVSGATNATTLATAFLALLQATTVPQEFKEITWTNPSAGVIVGTAVTAGKPFTVATSVTGGTGTFTSNSTTTTSSGPNDVSIAQNWSTGNLPANGDDIVFDQGSSSALYGLNQSAVTPNSITIAPAYTGTIGLPSINVDNSANTYIEYRPQYLQYGATTVTIRGGGGRIKLDNGTTQVSWNIYASTTRIDANIPQVLLKGTNANNAINCDKADAAVAWFLTEASTLLTINVDYQTNQLRDVYLWIGKGVTLTNAAITQAGGQLFVKSSVSTTTLVQYGGSATFDDAAALSSVNCQDASFVWNATGTLATAKVGGKGVIDFSQDLRAKTVTNVIELYGKNCQVLDPNAVVNTGTLTCGFNEVADSGQVNFGSNFRLTRSTTP